MDWVHEFVRDQLYPDSQNFQDRTKFKAEELCRKRVEAEQEIISNLIPKVYEDVKEQSGEQE